jgi:hypothetical protein
MLKIMLLIILSPCVLLCGILSVVIIYAILNKTIEIKMEHGNTVNNLKNNRDDK